MSPAKVRALLKVYGTSTALAAKLGVTSRAVEHWATGARSPRKQHIAAMERLAIASVARRLAASIRTNKES